ncbi:MAG: DNA replication/repair protein RecF, partial [Aestuariivirgaceae bacterium]
MHRTTDVLAIRRLTLKNFRNYADFRLDIDAPAVVLTGANGAGKTNFLEAISMLVPGRGVRGASLDELIRHGCAGWAVAAEIVSLGGHVTLGTAFGNEAAAEKLASGTRQVVIDGTAQKSPGPLTRYMRMLWLTPPMDRLFSGPRGDRRRFFDRLALAVDGDHAARLTRFDKLLRERNRLLASENSDPGWLASLEHRMAEEAVALAAGRLFALDSLEGFAGRPAGPAFPWVSLALEGEVEGDLRLLPAVQVEDRYRRMLHDSRRRDRAAGRTLSGPHRTDLKVIHGPKGIEAAICSTGEQKAMLIGIVLALARAMKNTLGGMLPILLLDEVVAHLDTERRMGLFRELRDIGAQCWLTGTDRALFDGMDPRAAFYAVSDG